MAILTKVPSKTMKKIMIMLMLMLMLITITYIGEDEKLDRDPWGFYQLMESLHFCSIWNKKVVVDMFKGEWHNGRGSG